MNNTAFAKLIEARNAATALVNEKLDAFTNEEIDAWVKSREEYYEEVQRQEDWLQTENDIMFMNGGWA